MSNNFDDQLRFLVESALREDVGDGDHSTLSSIGKDAKGKAVLKIKEGGFIAGIAVAKAIFLQVENQIQFLMDLQIASLLPVLQ